MQALFGAPLRAGCVALCDPGEVTEPAGSRTSFALVGESRALVAGAGGPAVARGRDSPQQRE